MKIVTLISLILVTAAVKTQAFNPQYRDIIADAVARVSTDSLRSYVRVLQNFKTRHSSQNAADVVPWLREKYRAHGCDSVFLMSVNGFGPNVIAQIQGTKPAPNKHCLLGAHFDAVLLDNPVAAGADDNASGTAALIEAARVLSAFDFENTIRLVSFNAEEVGFLGSKAYVDSAKNNKEEIVGGMINFDMIGYAKDAPCLYIHVDSSKPAVLAFGNYFKKTADAYVSFSIQVLKNTDVVHSSDHEAFLRYGFTAILGTETTSFKNIAPNAHRPNDLLDDPGGLNSSELMTAATRAAIAVLADLAKPCASATLPLGNAHSAAGFSVIKTGTSPGIMIRFSVTDEKAPVYIAIVTTQGKCVSLITNTTYPAGRHAIAHPLVYTPGVYIVVFRNGAARRSERVMCAQ